MRRTVYATALALCLGAVPGFVPASANDQSNDDDVVSEAVETILALDGDPVYGEYLGGECATCHRRSAPADGIPPISGIEERHFVQAMVEYRKKIRTNEVMRTTAARLSDEEIAALAAHFTEREPR